MTTTEAIVALADTMHQIAVHADIPNRVLSAHAYEEDAEMLLDLLEADGWVLQRVDAAEGQVH